MPRIESNGVELYYELHGPEDTPVLVLNNGIIMNAAMSWAYQTRAFSKHYRLLQYDCRGQGQSAHPAGPYSMALHAQDLAALLDDLAIEKAHILGISYGGEVAQAFVLEYPEKVRSLILADTVSEIGPELAIIGASWLDAARAGDAGAFFNATVPWNFSPDYIAANPALLADARERYKLLDYPSVVCLMETFLQVNFTQRLGEIQAPTCILVGEKDLLKGLHYAQILQRGITHAELHVLHGAAHATVWERHEVFNSVVLGFLAKQV